MDISLVIPAYNEEESLNELIQWIERVAIEHSLSYEIILIDDGSSDETWSIIEANNNRSKAVRGIKFPTNNGKAASLYCGFEMAEGDVIITMDADMQDSPDEIPELYRMIIEEDYDLVSGWKKKRFDPLGKTIPSKFFNLTARIVSGIKLHDFNCGLKAYKKAVVKNIEVYGEMHRYIPILSKKAGFKKIGEKIVQHNARKYGVSKYGASRMIKGYLDLITLTFMMRFSRSPMYFFGTIGSLLFLVGGFLSIYIVAIKLYLQCNNEITRSVTDQPLFFIALLMSIVGSQMFLSGFIAELINRKSTERNKYKIDVKL